MSTAYRESDSGQMLTLAQLLDWQDDEPEPLWDPTAIPPNRMFGARPGSGRWYARGRIHRARNRIEASHPDGWNPNDLRVLATILNLCEQSGTDVWTVHQRELARLTATPRRTLRDVVRRLVGNGWLVIKSPGRSGVDGSGSATVIGITGYGVAPVARHRGDSDVVGRQLAGRAQPDHGPSEKSSPPTKLLRNPLPEVPRYMVSGRDFGTPGTTETVRGGTIETVAAGTTETASPPKDLAQTLDVWLRAHLTIPQRAQDVIADAAREGFSRRAVYRSRDRLGVISEDVSFPGGGKGKPPIRASLWRLP